MAKGNEAALIAAVVAGKTLPQIAEAAGVAVSTVQRRLHEPEIEKLIAEARTRQRDEALGQAASLRGPALARLAELVESPNETVALRAIRLTLTTTMRLEEIHDLDQRLRALEAADDHADSENEERDAELD